MKYEKEVKEALIDNTIRLISSGGFEAATTRHITGEGSFVEGVRLNEVYIYRLFGSKEGLYSEVFARLDKELLGALCSCIDDAGKITGTFIERLYFIFRRAWSFLIGNEQRCRCYTRYYYSIYFKGSSLKSHNESFARVTNALAPFFKEEADVNSIMHSVLTAILDFAIRVYNGDLENSEENEYHIFNVLYNMMRAYLKVDTDTASVKLCPNGSGKVLEE